MDDSPGDLILDEKEEGVKFDKDTIIICEPMNGEQIFRSVRNMQNIAKMKISSRVTNY
jgi:hypothetical protein